VSSTSVRPDAGRAALLAEALLWLTAARLLMSILPFRRVAALLGLKESRRPSQSRPVDSATLAAVGWVIPALAQHLPWSSTCLVRALAGARLMHRRDVPVTLHLGARSTGDGTLLAHAWLSAGGRILLGARDAAGCCLLATFETAPAA
jgi:hypothetical protein